eukprot:6203245-Pleurochrysis_carterae.AAC.4
MLAAVQLECGKRDGGVHKVCGCSLTKAFAAKAVMPMRGNASTTRKRAATESCVEQRSTVILVAIRQCSLNGLRSWHSENAAGST